MDSSTASTDQRNNNAIGKEIADFRARMKAKYNIDIRGIEIHYEFCGAKSTYQSTDLSSKQ